MVTYLGLGSNLGDRLGELARAIMALAQHGQVAATSAFYETEPESGLAHPKYLNAAVRMETELSARSLLQACLGVEKTQGRIRPSGAVKAPRTIDIDLLLYGQDVISEPGLCVPHPALLTRPFVLIPLADVALPGLRHPITGEPLDRCHGDATVRRLR